ncbi:MAG TPA: OsmC family protein [Candidatus Acidoferrum sp.]|nr:OsmC family protein [Candidatus Acidoferrum sp.]
MGTHHEYRVKALCSGPRKGAIHAEAILPSITFSAPPEFLGEAGHWTPEHFLVASVASCFVSTFSGIAERSRFEFASLRLDAEGVLSSEDGGWRFTEIRLTPDLTMLREADRDRAMQLLEKAEKSCLIARSLQCKVTMLPSVTVEEELATSEASPGTCSRSRARMEGRPPENFFHGR